MTPGHGTEVLAGALAALVCHTAAAQTGDAGIVLGGLPLAQSSVGGYCIGEQSLINAEVQSTLSHPSFPSHRCLCSLIKWLFCSGRGLSAAFLASQGWSESQGIWCVRAAAAPCSPHPQPSLPLSSSLPFKQAQRAQICLALGPASSGLSGHVRWPFHKGSFSLNTEFSCPLSSTELLGMSSPSRNLSIYTGSMAGIYSGPSCWCLSSVFWSKRLKLRIIGERFCWLCNPPACSKMGLPKPPLAAGNGIMCPEEGKKGLERHPCANRTTLSLGKLGHYHWNTALRFFPLRSQVLLREWEKIGKFCKVQMALKAPSAALQHQRALWN